MPVRRKPRQEGQDDGEAKLQALVEELDVEVESRCQMLRSDAERMASWVKSEYKMLLEKLPKKVRDVQLAELQHLIHTFGGSDSAKVEEPDLPPQTPFRVINNPNGSTTVLRTTRRTCKISNISDSDGGKSVENDPAPRTTRRTTRQNHITATPAAGTSKVPQTPIFNSALPFTPAGQHGGGGPGLATCMRLPKRGESILSSRGSPLSTMNSDATAQMIMDGENKIAAFEIATGSSNGETVNLANPDACAKLPKHLRLKAAQNVLAMQAQLEAMLATLR